MSSGSASNLQCHLPLDLFHKPFTSILYALNGKHTTRNARFRTILMIWPNVYTCLANRILCKIFLLPPTLTDSTISCWVRCVRMKYMLNSVSLAWARTSLFSSPSIYIMYIYIWGGRKDCQLQISKPTYIWIFTCLQVLGIHSWPRWLGQHNELL